MLTDSDEASRLNKVECAPLATFLGQYPSMTTISPIASYHAHIAAWLAVAVTYITCDIGGPEIQAFQIATVAASMLQDYAGYQRLSGIENWDSNPR